jgi:hypothetical protein
MRAAQSLAQDGWAGLCLVFDGNFLARHKVTAGTGLMETVFTHPTLFA